MDIDLEPLILNAQTDDIEHIHGTGGLHDGLKPMEVQYPGGILSHLDHIG